MSTQSMRAALIAAPLRAEMRDACVPQPAATEIRIKLQGCGVCGSNIPVWEGRPWFRYPLEAGAPGHEGWGIVDQVGDNVSEFSRGDRVVFLSDHAFAEHDIAPAAHAFRLPPKLDGVPFPAEPLACAMNVFRRSGIREGDLVAIIGIGFLGALLTRLAVNAGARVVAISRRPIALRTAEAFGAAATFAFNSVPLPVESALKFSDGNGYDCVIEAVGIQETLDLASQLTKERGTLVIAGYHQDALRQVNMQLWNWRGLDVINAHERDPRVYIQGMKSAVEAVLSGTLDPSPLYTHIFPLEHLSDALEMTRHRDDSFLKALVVP